MEPLKPGEPGSGGNATFSRRVCAVLLADVAGYSTLMGEDDERTARAVRALQKLVSEIVTAHGGHAESTAGDAIFATFESVASAVEAALGIQKRTEAEKFDGVSLRLRIGVHFGDVLIDEQGARGDAINVAARLQELARPGTICVSDGVYRQVRHVLDEKVVDLGRQRLKNISDPVRAYLIVPGGGRDVLPVTSRLSRWRWGTAALAVSIGLVAAYVVGRARLDRLSAPSGTPARDAAPLSAQANPVQAPVSLGVMHFEQLGGDLQQRWMRDALRDGINTQLSSLSNVKVYSKEFIDFLVERQGLSEIEVANTLHITKILTGSYLAVGDKVKIDAHLVDVQTGVLQSSYTTTGSEEKFLDLLHDVVMGIVARLDVPVTDQEKEALVAQRSSNVEALRMLLEAEGGAGARREPPATPRAADPEPRSGWLPVPLSFARTAYAANPEDDETKIRDLIERYRRATESERVDALASVYADLSAEQRAAQQRYFENVRELRVTIDAVDVAVVGDEAVVSYTRTDRFVDGRTGRPMHVAIRLTKTLRRTGEGWKLNAGE